MSRLGFNTQMFSRCGGTWLRASPVVAPMGSVMAIPICHNVRHVSTTRPTKAQAMKDSLKETVAAAPTTKAPKASTTTKSKKTSMKATAVEKEGKTTAQAKKTEATKAKTSKTKAASTATAESKPRAAVKTATTSKTGPAPTSNAAANTSIPPTPRAPEPVTTLSVAAKKQSTIPVSARSAPSQQYNASKTSPTDAPIAPRPSSAPTSPPNPSQTRASDKPKPRVNTSSPEYKRAEWKWTSTIIALPFLIVTSYLLFDRLVLGNEPNLEKIREKIRGVTSSDGPETAASEVEVQTDKKA